MKLIYDVTLLRWRSNWYSRCNHCAKISELNQDELYSQSSASVPPSMVAHCEDCEALSMGRLRWSEEDVDRNPLATDFTEAIERIRNHHMKLPCGCAVFYDRTRSLFCNRHAIELLPLPSSERIHEL